MAVNHRFSMPRLAVPTELRSKTHTFSFYDEEKAAIDRLVLKMKLHSPFDLMRYAISQATHPSIVKERNAGSFRNPRFASKRTLGIRKKLGVE